MIVQHESENETNNNRLKNLNDSKCNSQYTLSSSSSVCENSLFSSSSSCGAAPLGNSGGRDPQISVMSIFQESMSNVNMGNLSSQLDDRNASDSLDVPSNSSSISYGEDNNQNNSLQYQNISTNLFSDGDVIVDVSFPTIYYLIIIFSKGVYLRAALTT